MLGDYRFDPRNIVRDVPVVGICELRLPTLATERVLWPFYDDKNADANAFVDALVSHTLLSPRLSYDDVRTLAPSVRTALRAAVAAVCALPVASSSSDRALLDAMRARRDRLTSAAVESPASFPLFIGRWLDEMRERVHASLRGADVGKTVLAFAQRLSEAGEVARRVVQVYDEQPLAFVLLEAHFENSFELLLDTVEQGDHILADIVQSALVADGRFMAAARAAVGQSGSLSDAQKEKLSLGLEELTNGHWNSSCCLLMGGVESAIWTGATREGVIDSERRLLNTATRGRPKLRIAKSVNNLLDEGCGLLIGGHLRHFLHDKVFSGPGHELRHGRSHEGADEYSKWAFVALLGWLDCWDNTDFMTQVGDRLDAALEPALAA